MVFLKTLNDNDIDNDNYNGNYNENGNENGMQPNIRLSQNLCFAPQNKTAAVTFSAEQKHTNIKTVKIRFCYQKNDSESGFYVEIFEINLSNFILYVFFSRELALWRTPVRLREPNHDFCI